MIRFFNVVIFTFLFAISSSARVQDQVYEWENGGTIDTTDCAQDTGSSENEHGTHPLLGSPSSGKYLLLGTTSLASIATILCMSNVKCREFVANRFTNSKPADQPTAQPFGHIQNVPLATPERCREFARQAQADTGIRDWKRVPPRRLNEYIQQLKQIAVESGHPIPGTPQ